LTKQFFCSEDSSLSVVKILVCLFCGFPLSKYKSLSREFCQVLPLLMMLVTIM